MFDLPLNWLNQVGWVHITAEVSYSNLLALLLNWVRDEWLAVDGVELNATKHNQ